MSPPSSTNPIEIKKKRNLPIFPRLSPEIHNSNPRPRNPRAQSLRAWEEAKLGARERLLGSLAAAAAAAAQFQPSLVRSPLPLQVAFAFVVSDGISCLVSIAHAQVHTPLPLRMYRSFYVGGDRRAPIPPPPRATLAVPPPRRWEEWTRMASARIPFMSSAKPIPPSSLSCCSSSAPMHPWLAPLTIPTVTLNRTGTYTRVCHENAHTYFPGNIGESRARCYAFRSLSLYVPLCTFSSSSSHVSRARAPTKGAKVRRPLRGCTLFIEGHKTHKRCAFSSGRGGGTTTCTPPPHPKCGPRTVLRTLSRFRALNAALETRIHADSLRVKERADYIFCFFFFIFTLMVFSFSRVMERSRKNVRRKRGGGIFNWFFD